MHANSLETIARKANLTQLRHKSRWLDKDGLIKDIADIPSGVFHDKYGRNGICLNFGKEKLVVMERYPQVFEALVLSCSFDLGELGDRIDLDAVYRLTLASQTIDESASLSVIVKYNPRLAIELVINNVGGVARVSGLGEDHLRTLLAMDKDRFSKMVVGGTRKQEDGSDRRVFLLLERGIGEGDPRAVIYDHGTTLDNRFARTYSPRMGDAVEVRVCKTTVRMIRKILEDAHAVPKYYVSDVVPATADCPTCFVLSTNFNGDSPLSIPPVGDTGIMVNYDVSYTSEMAAGGSERPDSYIPLEVITNALVVLQRTGLAIGAEATALVKTPSSGGMPIGPIQIDLKDIKIQSKI